MNEQNLRIHFGWRPGSRMTERYSHLSGKDTDDAVLRANGVKTSEERVIPGLKTIACPVCKKPNDPTYSYCSHCFAPLTGASVSLQGLRDVLRNLIDTELKGVVMEATVRTMTEALDEADKLAKMVDAGAEISDEAKQAALRLNENTDLQGVNLRALLDALQRKKPTQ